MSAKCSIALKITIIFGFLFFVHSLPVWANVGQIKLYKAAYPDEKPKCSCCHVDEKPKKDGPNGLNEYGNKVKSIKAVIDEDSYAKAGKSPS